MIERESGVGGGEACERDERDLSSVGRLRVNSLQRIRILLELRILFQDHVILIELGKNRGDLALAKGIVKRVVNVGGKNAESRGGVAINRDGSDETLVQLVAGDVAKYREGFQFSDETRSPVGELFGVDIFEAVLELRTTDAVFHGQVLDRLEEEGNAIDFSERGLQPANHIGGADFALRERHEIDLDAPAGQRSVPAVHADERGKAFDRRILENDLGKSLLALGHGREGSVLRPFRDAKNHAGILDRKKSFGNVNVEKNCAD